MASQAALKVPSAVGPLAEDNIFAQLDDDEKEQSARASSYKYATTARRGAGERDALTRAMIARYLAVERKLGTHATQWEDRCLAKLRSTLRYRKEMQVDDIRACFDKEKKESDVHAAIRAALEERFAPGCSVVRGYSKAGRALFLNFPRHETTWDSEEYYIKGNIYMLERALACTERNTIRERNTVVIVYDYNGYRLRNSPPPLFVHHLLADLRDHWPERLEHVFLVDTPFVFRAFWSVIKHFIDPVTKGLVQFVTGDLQKERLRELVDANQAAPFMFEGGRDADEADMRRFFHDVPFDRVYGEK